MVFEKITHWGKVQIGTTLLDDNGFRYIVDQHEDNECIKLRNISGGDDQVFKIIDPIDHDEFIYLSRAHLEQEKTESIDLKPMDEYIITQKDLSGKFAPCATLWNNSNHLSISNLKFQI